MAESKIISWESPSNIALVKYWGKKDNQIPCNASISFTLSNCKTTTEVYFIPKEESAISFDIYFEGEKNEAFRPKIESFLSKIVNELPFLNTTHLDIHSSNSFPHSSGIASSASSMSALALCLLSYENNTYDDAFYQKASLLSRLGSGSACRSLYGGLVSWGNHHDLSNSSDEFGSPFMEANEVFTDFNDIILIVESGKKSVSSTQGHQLMHQHPFAEQRFIQANENISKIKEILKNGSLTEFCELVELEALSLHAMMMTSSPSFILMKPNTLNIIEKIRAFREQKNIPVCFTLDAGANVHLLFPNTYQQAVEEFVKEELVAYCEKQQYICDKVGQGPKLLRNEVRR